MVYSNIADYRKHILALPVTSREHFLLLVKHNVLNKVYVSDTKATFQPLDMLVYSVATCAGLRRESLNFRDYTQPYDLLVWITGMTMFGSLSLVAALCLPKHSDSVWLIALSFLLEHWLPISHRLLSTNIFRYVFGVFLLSGIVLTNSYKGVITTSIIKPFRILGIESFDVIFNTDQFRLYFDPLRAEGPLRATEYVKCCNAQTESGFSPECKQRIVGQLVSSVSYFFSFAALGLFDIERKLKLRAELSGNSSRIEDIPENLFSGSNNVNAVSDTLLIKLIKMLEPPPAQCPTDDPPRPDVMTPLLECKNSLYILPQPEMDQLLFQAELDPSTYKGLYRVPDEKTMEIVPAAIAGYNAHFIQYLKHVFQRPARAFVESGVYRHLVSIFSARERHVYVSRIRQREGSIRSLNRPMDGLSFKRKAKLVFIVYGICVLISVGAYFLEVFQQLSSENRGANVNRKDSSRFGSRSASVGQFFKEIQSLWYLHSDSGRVTHLRPRDTVQTIQVRKVEDFHIRIQEHITPIQHSEERKGDDSLIRWKRSVQKINMF